MEEAILLHHLEVLEEVEMLENNPPRDFWSRWKDRAGDPFINISDQHFIKLFRLSKEVVLELLADLEAILEPPSRVSAIPLEMKLLITLKFLAMGNYQTDVGLNKHLPVSQSTTSRCIKQIVDALNDPRIFNRWVNFSFNPENLNRMRTKFYQAYDIPGTVGVVDCTHIAIFPPSGNEHVFVNRKSYHSINTQLVCDINLKILNVNARYPGSVHDAFIWRNSNIKQSLEQASRNDNNFTYYLIADSGYPLRKWLQIPVPNVVDGTPAARYNTQLCRARSLIERCNGLLKMRFRCLLKHRVLHYTPKMSGKIINACCVITQHMHRE